MDTAHRWPNLILHYTSGGTAMPDGTDAGLALKELARAWRAGDVGACLSLSPPLFDALDARCHELLHAPDFPTDPSVEGVTSPSMELWKQCAVAQASVALTMALAAWLSERGERLISRMPGLVGAGYPQWAGLFPAGPWGDNYSGPHCLPMPARASVLGALLIAEDFEPGVVRRALGGRPGEIDIGFLAWMLPIAISNSTDEARDPRVGAVAAIHAIITQMGAGLGIVDDPDERRIAAAAHGSLAEDRWFGRPGGPFATSAFDRVARRLALDRRTALALRLELLSRYQHDPAYAARLLEFSKRLTAAPEE